VRGLTLGCAFILLIILAFAFIAVGTSSGPRAQVYASWVGIIVIAAIAVIGIARFWNAKAFGGPMDWVLAGAIFAPFLFLILAVVYNAAFRR
jgi:hypothetical protein